jgi:hypothetical protein
MKDKRIHQIREHLYVGLAIMDVVRHVEDPRELWRGDSVAYAMELAFQEWKAAEYLLNCLDEDLQERSCSRSPVPAPTNQGIESLTNEPPNGTHQQ